MFLTKTGKAVTINFLTNNRYKKEAKWILLWRPSPIMGKMNEQALKLIAENEAKRVRLEVELDERRRHYEAGLEEMRRKYEDELEVHRRVEERRHESRMKNMLLTFFQQVTGPSPVGFNASQQTPPSYYQPNPSFTPFITPTNSLRKTCNIIIEVYMNNIYIYMYMKENNYCCKCCIAVVVPVFIVGL